MIRLFVIDMWAIVVLLAILAAIILAVAWLIRKRRREAEYKRWRAGMSAKTAAASADIAEHRALTLEQAAERLSRTLER